ncbi:unnamed protein product [Miscanthus lutarioriparius]|uniref:aspartate--tRNA ligase n=1 Tax=Miscanthus lutarioriparius TaxID=422564 RepID=A0A811PID5_9POAL|nr:unnamed protein product [Miscanthus lutarioriparius]
MAICGGFERVFEVGPVFRAETSRTPRQACLIEGFTGILKDNVVLESNLMLSFIRAVCDVIAGLFVSIFRHLNENCKEELGVINKQRPFEPVKYLEQTLKLTFEEGILMLNDAGTELEPMGDLTTEAEKVLGRLVKEKYGTDFYILHRYPLAVRPFYTMPCPDNPAYSNSFDVFIQGQEIISGAQRIHSREMLARRAEECGIDINTISAYMESFSHGAPPHGGFGVGLERVAALFCGLNNIKEMSMSPVTRTGSPHDKPAAVVYAKYVHIVLTVKYDRGVKDGKKKRKSNSNAIKKNQIGLQICKIQRKAVEASLAWQIKPAHAGFFRQASRFCYN